MTTMKSEKQLDDAARIRRQDVDEARAYWKRNAEPKWKELIEAEIDKR